jgi:hypothetical protein
VYLVDTAPVADVRKSREGYLQVNARAARTGVYNYRGDEVERPDLDVVRVYRPADEVFKRDTIKSFTSLDVTLGHPNDMVGPDNWRDTVVGFTGEDVIRDGEFVRVPLTLRDRAAIAEVESGCRELSFGYYCQLEFKDGIAPSGEPYDAIQRNLQGNHLAIVPAGRAGSHCRIGDAGHFEGTRTMPETVITRTIDIDGIPVRVNDDAGRVIETLRDKIRGLTDATSKTAGEHAAALGARDAEIITLKAQIADKDKTLGTRDAEITTLRAQVADASQIDALAAERAELFARAGALGLTDADVKGKATDEIVKLAVSRSQGEDAVKDKDPNYLRGVFDYLSSHVQDAPTASSATPGYDPIARVMRGGVGDAASPQAAWQGMVDRMQNAWKNPMGVPNANGR